MTSFPTKLKLLFAKCLVTGRKKPPMPEPPTPEWMMYSLNVFWLQPTCCVSLHRVSGGPSPPCPQAYGCGEWSASCSFCFLHNWHPLLPSSLSHPPFFNYISHWPELRILLPQPSNYWGYMNVAYLSTLQGRSVLRDFLIMPSLCLANCPLSFY